MTIMQQILLPGIHDVFTLNVRFMIFIICSPHKHACPLQCLWIMSLHLQLCQRLYMHLPRPAASSQCEPCQVSRLLYIPSDLCSGFQLQTHRGDFSCFLNGAHSSYDWRLLYVASDCLHNCVHDKLGGRK